MTVIGVDGRTYKDQASADKAAARMAKAPKLDGSATTNNTTTITPKNTQTTSTTSNTGNQWSSTNYKDSDGYYSGTERNAATAGAEFGGAGRTGGTATTKVETPKVETTKTEATGGAEFGANSTSSIDKLRNSWNNMTYEQQQQKLGQIKGLRESLAKYGITIKTQGGEAETSTTPTTPTTPKSGTSTSGGKGDWDYQDNSPERMMQMVNNLEGLYQTDPGLFTNEETFSNFFINGKGRSPEQEQFLMDYYKNRQTYNKYDGITAENAGNLLAHGQIPQNYLSYVKNSNPDRYAAIMDAKDRVQDQIKADASMDTINAMTGEDTDNLAWQKKEGLLVDENGDLIDDRRYHEATQEEKDKVARINAIDAELLDINNTIKHTYEDLVKAYPGASKATLMAMAQDTNNTLLRKKEDLMVERTELAGSVEYMQSERQQQDAAGADTITQLQKNLGMYYTYSPQGIAERAQAQYAATNVTLDQADNGTDTQKQMALQSVLDGYYAKYGSIIERSEQQVINDVMALAKQKGISLSQALEDNFLKQLRQKSGFNQLNTVQNDPYVVKVGDVAYRYNPTTDKFELIGGGASTSTTTPSLTTIAGNEWSNGNQVKLNEEVVDTGIKNVYGSNVKLTSTVGNMLQDAVDNLKSQGIDLQVGDSYRSYETQKKAYEEDQAKPANQRKGVAKPGTSFHELGQAVDIAQNQMNDPAVIQAMLDAGFTRPVKSEPRHWSYGEGADAFGGVSSKTKEAMSDPYSGTSGYTSNGTPINNGGWITSLEEHYTNGFKDKDERKDTLAAYGIDEKIFDEQQKAYGKRFADNKWQETMQDRLNLLLELYDWETGKNNGWGDYHTGLVDKSVAKDGDEGRYRYDDLLGMFGSTASQGKNIYDLFMKDETLNKFLDLKQNGATFGAMSNAEWKIIEDSITKLHWDSKKDTFQKELESLINEYTTALQEKGIDLPTYTLQYGGKMPDLYLDEDLIP